MSLPHEAAPEESIPVPDILPVLPVLDTVVFPYIILPLSVGQDRNMLAVDKALANSRVVMLVAQKDSAEDALNADLIVVRSKPWIVS